MALALTAGTVPGVGAVPLMPLCADGPGLNLTTGCLAQPASRAGGGDTESAVEAAIRQATDELVDVSLYGASDDNPGLFSFTPDNGNSLTNSVSGWWEVLDATLISYLSIKAATEFVLFQFDPVSFGRYSSAAIQNRNGRSQNVSHIRFWTTTQDETPRDPEQNEDPPRDPEQVAVPLPSTLALLGLGVLGLKRRRCRGR